MREKANLKEMDHGTPEAHDKDGFTGNPGFDCKASPPSRITCMLLSSIGNH